MNKTIKTIIFAALTVIGFASCENDGFFFQDAPSVRLVGDENWTLGTDSAEISFQNIIGESLDFIVDVCIIGAAVDHDRTVNIAVDASRTTASTSLYQVPATVTVPAGATKGTFTIHLAKDAILQTKSVSLGIKVADSKDFVVGVKEQDHLLIKWTDKITKPLYWDNITEFFGTYSEVKYRFMLKSLLEAGYSTNLDPASGLNWGDLHNLQIVCANKLAEYNATHSTPLTDENGAIVSF